MGGSYTAGFVARRPTASEIGGVNPGAGPIIGANNTSAALSGLFLNYYTGFSVYHNGSPVGSATGETPGTAIACLVSFDAIAHTVTIWQNGTVVGTASSVTTGWTAGNNLLIGAALFSGGSYYSILDIAGVFLLCGTAVANGSSQAAVINTWLNACRSSVT
jgi:hypothetical protein